MSNFEELFYKDVVVVDNAGHFFGKGIVIAITDDELAVIFTKDTMIKVSAYRCILKERYMRLMAMKLTNSILELAEVNVAQRQAINDRCDEFFVGFMNDWENK